MTSSWEVKYNLNNWPWNPCQIFIQWISHSEIFCIELLPQDACCSSSFAVENIWGLGRIYPPKLQKRTLKMWRRAPENTMDCTMQKDCKALSIKVASTPPKKKRLKKSETKLISFAALLLAAALGVLAHRLVLNFLLRLSTSFWQLLLHLTFNLH